MGSFASIRRQDTDCGCDLGLYIDDSAGFDLTQRYVVITILGVSIYNCVELIPFIFATFKRYKGLYFWSLFVSILGILMSNISNLVSNFYPDPPRLEVGFVGLFGWAFMVTGQSLVLYSRLDLLPLGDKTRRWVLRVIIFNAVVMQVPIIVLNTGAKSARPERFLPVFSIYERIQVIVFFLQEFGLSCVYLWECFRFLVIPDMPTACSDESGGFGSSPQKNSRKVLLHLLIVSIAVIVLDITVIVLEFSGFHIIQISYKELAYSIKLKLEISVLSRLIQLYSKHSIHINANADSAQRTRSYHGGNKEEAYPAQDLTVDRIA
ncbi:putative integral membrane protein [Diaporthe ampelina]|uniref:Putative integral membrane protein n=1 Tax=Diaporthe ampelina TaxID=1214573 RepID=A0A0G2HN25_9PEZI|nr:putative integral membrane protein [Diaporthe ampelina]